MIKHKFLTLFVAIYATTALWASNVITYTATEKLTTSALDIGKTTFGSAITSHDFSNGIGTITCDGEITTIGHCAFCWSILTSVTIPNSVTTIGESAFAYCSGLTSITIPNSVTTIGDGVFEECHNLTSVTIPNSVTTIGVSVFSNCKGLTSITIPNSVTTIGTHAFSGCGLNSIIIPSSVTTIGGHAFAWCYGLTSITCEANTPPTCGSYCFDKVDKSIPLYVPDGSVGTYKVTHEWMDFTNIQPIPDETYIVTYTAAKKLSGYDGSLNVGRYTFGPVIKSHIFSNGIGTVICDGEITTIGTSAFYYCSNLITITIPNSVLIIKEEAFFGCSGLTSITIPNSVKRIESSAFNGCEGLKFITCEATTPPLCQGGCFSGVEKSIPLYVPAGSVNAYKVADEWKDFTNIFSNTAKEVEVTEIEAEPTESAVEIAWPSVVNAETYTIEIRLGDQLICSIVFNAQGQLVSINFNLAPGRGGHTYATTAESTATGWAYTIAGLTPGITYTYSVIAKNADEQVIDTKSGSFTTKGATAIENVSADVNTTKFLHNGQVIIRQGNKEYDAVGREVK